VTLRPALDNFRPLMPMNMYRGRAIGDIYYPCSNLRSLDTERFDFGVVVKRTCKFDPKRNLKPSTKAPPRERGEYQAWVTVTDELLETPLDKLKRMVLASVHSRPGITMVITLCMESSNTSLRKGSSLYLAAL
jgi:hypothetical protein